LSEDTKDGAANERLSAAIAAISPAAVQVHGTASPITASGVVWTADGIVVTTHSGTWNDQGVQVTLPSGETLPALVLGRDPTTDLLVLQISGLEGSDGGTSPLQVPERAHEGALAVGHLAVAVGRRGGGLRASWGSVTELSGPWTTPLGGRVDARIEVDAPLPRGLTGGPLVDVHGRLLGVNTRRLDRGGTTLPVATVDRVVAAIRAEGSLRPAWLGAAVMPVALPASVADAEGQTHGLILLSVEEEGPAAAAGWLQGDVLLRLGDAVTSSPGALRAALGPDRVGEELTARLVRAGAPVDLAITPAARPEGLDDEHEAHGGWHHRRWRRGGHHPGHGHHGPGHHGGHHRGRHRRHARGRHGHGPHHGRRC